MAQCLLTIPEVLLMHVLVEWLALPSVVRLDSAVCNRKLRPSFLSAAYYGECTVHEVSRVSKVEQCVQWSLKRDAKVDGVRITDNLASDQEWCAQFLSIQGRYLRWIILANPSCDCRPVLLTVATHCPNVLYLTVNNGTGASIPNGTYAGWDSCLLQLTQSCQELKTLDISPPLSAALSTRGLADALRQCRNLTELCLYCRGLTFPIEIAIPSLTSLHIGDGVVSEEVLLAIGTNCSQLQTLFIFKYAAASDAAVRALLHGCPLLCATDVEHASGIHHELRTELARRCNLTYLELNQWADIDEELALRVMAVCPGLAHLKASYSWWLTDDVLAACGQHCPLLERVELTECNRITSEGMVQLIRPGSRLKLLTIKWCTKLHARILIHIAQHCPALQTLRVTGDAANDSAVARLAECCPQLAYLSVAYSGLSDEGVGALARHCRKLEGLELLHCVAVTKWGLRVFLEHCLSLRYLRLDYSLDEQLSTEFQQIGVQLL